MMTGPSAMWNVGPLLGKVRCSMRPKSADEVGWRS